MTKQLKIGVIGIPGKWSTETLADAIEAKTGYRLVIDMADCHLDLRTQSLFYQGVDLSTLDALIIKKISQTYSPSMLDRIELLRVPESKGVKIFSPPESIIRLVDRLSCTITLNQANIPMPETVITEDIEAAVDCVNDFKSTVFKPLFSTKARGMTIIDSDLSDKKIKAKISEFKKHNQMMYIQKKINLPGHDMGLVFLAGEYLGTYARVNQGDSWNTTIHSGGKYMNYQPSQEIIDMAKSAQEPFKLDYTTVDVAETDTGPIVFEVSAFGGFKGALEGIGINAAELYTDYVIQQLN
ncbi:MAG: GAK system ATP-grasp enzyme [Gammaproteobacteria bacterium]|nr:GAK system ATP-grasp enzyme [Gammaproteobacteria bacterium]